MSASRDGTPLGEMLLNEVAQRSLQLRGVPEIAASLRGPNIIDDHVAHQQFSAWPADQMVSELQRHDLRKMLVLGDRLDFLLAECAKPQAVLIGQQRGPPSVTPYRADPGTENVAPSSLMRVKAQSYRGPQARFAGASYAHSPAKRQ
jgi:hypothetical protein